MSSTTCPHGLPRETCQICRVLDPSIVPASRAGQPDRRGGRLPGSITTIAIVAVVGLVAFGWVAAAFFAVVRILELVAIAAVAGWVGWKLGVRQGGRRP
ncbi:MAG: hypothetical protein ACR2KK_18015 [Acidimicrobiales bacterium]